MPQVPKTYQYGTTDDPNKIAAQFGISPQQLINANPGGYPFSTGQTINIPFANTFAGTTPLQAVANQAFTYPANPNAGIHQGPRPGGPTVPVTPGSISVGEAIAKALGVDTTFHPSVSGYQYANQYLQGQATAYKNEHPAIPKGPTPYWQLAAQSANGVDTGPRHITEQIMQRIATNPEELNNLTPAQQEAFMRVTGLDLSGTTTGNESGGGEDTFDPRLYQIQFNKNAKNRSSTFQTNLKWAQNAWKRKRAQAKGRPTGKQIANAKTAAAAAAAQQDNSVSGFGLVNFSAGSG